MLAIIRFKPRPELRFLPVDAADLPAAARFITARNAQTATQCLHCPATSAGAVNASLRREDNFPGGWTRWFFKTVDADGEIVALLGCQPDCDQTQGWMWGPWWSPAYQASDALTGLLEETFRRLPASMRHVDAFLHVDNQAGSKFLRSAGFGLRQVTHLYTAPRPSVLVPSAKEGLPYLRTMHEVAFTALHASSFPASTHTGQEMLAARDEDHVILAATDGLRLLGYACVSVNHTPHEGFIEYLAVKPAARGRGVGRWLLDQTLRWIFLEKELPQAALCVTEWRDNARRLYERAGFELSASGRGARRQLTR